MLTLKAVAAALIAELFIGPAGASAAELHVVVKDQRGAAVPDAVVLATPLDRRLLEHAKPQTETVDQVDKEFVPRVKAIYVGSLVRFPNKDQIRHEVYSFSPAKTFESKLYAGSTAPPVLFDKPGVVVLGCNIHDWMIGYIYVSDTPFFGTTATAGTARLSGLPPGDYAVRVWHPDMGQAEASTDQQVKLAADSSISLEWRLTLKPAYRIPRVSGGSLNSAYP
jgi:plastocyanin